MTNTLQKDMNKRKWVPFNQLNQIYSNEINASDFLKSRKKHVGLNNVLTQNSSL